MDIPPEDLAQEALQEFEAQEADNTQPGIPVYTSVELSAGNPDLFYDYQVASQLAGQLADIIETEGPVSEAVLFRKVARAWVLTRTGQRIVRRLSALAPSTARKTEEGGGIFYWPKAFQPGSMAYFRIADDTDDSKRHIDEVCIEELSALVLHVLHQAGSSPRLDVAKSVCRSVGMSVATSTAIERALLAIESLKTQQKIIESEGYIRLQV